MGNTFKEGREEKELRSAMRRGDQSASRKKIGDWYHRIQKNRKFQGGVVKIINRAKWTSNIRMKTARFIWQGQFQQSDKGRNQTAMSYTKCK